MFREEFCKPGARQGTPKPPKMSSWPPQSPLLLCSPYPRLGELGAQPRAPELCARGDLPRVQPGTCHRGSKGRLMEGFYYSQVCEGILPLFVMAFPLVTTEPQTGAGSVCFHISRCAFKAAALGAEPFPALFLAAFCILLGERGWRRGSVTPGRAQRIAGPTATALCMSRAPGI